MESGQFQRVETQPDEKPDRFSIFLNTKSNKSKRMSINRLSLQSDIMDSVPRFRRTKYHHPFRNTLSNHSRAAAKKAPKTRDFTLIILC